MEGWKESLSAEIQEKGIVKNAATFEDFVNKAIGADSMLGRSISIPGVDATTEEHTAFRDKVVRHSDSLIDSTDRLGTMMKWGLPENKDGYQVDPDRTYSLNDDQMAQLKADAHGSAMTQEQFYANLHTIDDRIKSQGDEATTALDADRAAIFEEWGAGKADKLDAIDAYMNLMGADEGMKKAVRENMSAAQLAFFSKAAASVKGESIQAAKDKSSGADLLTPPEAETAIKKIMDGDAYFDASNPGYKHARHRVMQLNDMAAGRKPQNEYGAPIVQVQR